MAAGLYMPTIILIAGGLVHPLLWCGWPFLAVGQRVKRYAPIGKTFKSNTLKSNNPLQVCQKK